MFFGGYISSTKDVRPKSRSVTILQTVEIDESCMCSTDRNELLTNYANKENFVTALAAKVKLTVSKLFSTLVMLTLPLSKLH